MRLTHKHAMESKKTALSERSILTNMTPFPERTFRTIGVKMRMNVTGRSHNKPNSTMGKSSWKPRLFTSSRIMNGRTRAELLIADSLRFGAEVARVDLKELYLPFRSQKLSTEGRRSSSRVQAVRSCVWSCQ
jgi:hypothetical protein